MQRPPQELLGAHVRRGADGGLGARHVGGLGEIAGETEVGELEAAVGVEQQVGGLDVAVQDLLGVQRRESFEHLAGGVDDLGDRQRPALQPVGEAAAGHPLHDDGEAVSGLDELEDADQAGVLEGAAELDLAAQPLAGGGGEIGAKDLDRHRLAELEVLGEPDLGLAALAEQADRRPALRQPGHGAVRARHGPSPGLGRGVSGIRRRIGHRAKV